MKPVSNEILMRAIRHAVYLEQLKNSEVRRLIRLFNNDIEPDVMALIEKHIGRGTFTEKRLAELSKANQAVIATGYKNLEKDFTKELKEIGITEAQWNALMLKQVVPIDFDFVTPHLATLKSAVSNSYVHGKLLKDWFDDLGRQTASRITQQINIGIANGESIYHITRRIRGTRAAGFADGILQESRRNIESVVRTAVTQTVTNSSEELYKANSDIVKGVQMVATLDSRTTEICMGYDGKVFGIDEGPRPPFHYQCRTRTIPVLKSWKEMGIKLKEAPEGTRASMDGQVSAKKTYGTWLKEQKPEFQNEVLGPTRANLFRSGKVRIDNFTRDGRLLNLEELRKREGLSYRDISVNRKKAS